MNALLVIMLVIMIVSILMDRITAVAMKDTNLAIIRSFV